MQRRPLELVSKLAWVVAFAVVNFSGLANAESPPLLLRQPTVSHNQIAFSFGGDLWVASRAGGDAQRLTSDVGFESSPLFSPDGSLIAFTGEYDGNEDVFVIPATGGQPKRLTSHPGSDQAVGWTPDGKRIVFRSQRASYSHYDRLFTVSVEGGLPEEIPLPMGTQGSYSPDGSRLAYVPFSNFKDSWSSARGLKHYRGGTASPIWVARLSDSSIEKVPRTNSNDSTPMWIGNIIYFLSDRDGPVRLYAYDTGTKQVSLAVASGGADIKSASKGPDAVVYEQLGSLHLFDVKTGKAHAVDIHVRGDFAAVRAHFINVKDQIESADLSPSGARAVFEAHGEILTAPAEHGDIRDLANTPGVAERSPAWSPDGKLIAYFSDASGEYALHLRPQDGVGETRIINLGPTPSFFYSPVWSPDSKRIAFTDKRLNLWVVDVQGGKPVLVDTSPFEGGPGSEFGEVWSPDGRYLAYTRMLNTKMCAVFIYDPEKRARHQITDGMSDAASAAFDRNGRYLYFAASTDDGPANASSMGSFKLPTTRSGYLVVLGRDQPSPLKPLDDEEKGKGSAGAADKANAALEDDCLSEGEEKGDKRGGEAKKGEDAKSAPPVKIDFENIDQRILALPIPARNYSGFVAGKSHVLFLLEGPAVDDGTSHAAVVVHKFDLCTRKTDKVLENVRNFVVSAEASHVLYEQLPEPKFEPPSTNPDPPHGTWFIKPVDTLGKAPEPNKPDGSLKLDGMEVFVDPRAEWEQMYREVWRIERDFFYDPNLHGADLKGLMAASHPFVAGVMSRGDLNYLFADMLGDITAQHVYINGGQRPDVRHVGGGLLGADYTVEHGRYRFAHIYRGENWNPDLRAPLTEPGVNVQPGDYLLAVNGRELRGADEVFSFFEDTAGKTVQLKVAADPAGKGARTVAVVPIPSEAPLRLRAWMDENRRKVEKLSDGRLAYVYLPDTHRNGFANFNRYYFAQADRQGAVIDERFNGGGWIADYIVDWLSRPLLAAAMTREGRDSRIPESLQGPKVMVINQFAGSGGDALPWMFRRLGLGPLVGTRTWGGLIGIGGYPPLLDGGRVTAPRWGLFNPQTGEFDVENKGVAPDIEVEDDPALWRKGQDPQLERAVATALSELKTHPPEPIKRPKYPIYDWSDMRQKASVASP